jgi:hypothetical protein
MLFRLLVGATGLLYAASLMLPAFSCYGGVDGMSGLSVLVVGWMGLLEGDPRWFANPLFFVIFVLSMMVRTIASRGAVALACMLAILAIALAIGALIAPASGCPRGDYVSRATGLADGGVVWVIAVTSLSVLYLGRVWALFLRKRACRALDAG